MSPALVATTQQAKEREAMPSFCKHCHSLLEDEEYSTHYDEVVKPLLEERAARGGIFVTIDGDEYWGPTVEELQSNGFKVVLRHNRLRLFSPMDLMFGRSTPSGGIRPKGGSTYILLLAPDGYWAEGRSRCSRKDVYSKHAGYVLAVNQALSKLPGELYSFDASFVNALEESKNFQDND